MYLIYYLLQILISEEFSTPLDNAYECQIFSSNKENKFNG